MFRQAAGRPAVAEDQRLTGDAGRGKGHEQDSGKRDEASYGIGGLNKMTGSRIAAAPSQHDIILHPFAGCGEKMKLQTKILVYLGGSFALAGLLVALLVGWRTWHDLSEQSRNQMRAQSALLVNMLDSYRLQLNGWPTTT